MKSGRDAFEESGGLDAGLEMSKPSFKGFWRSPSPAPRVTEADGDASRGPGFMQPLEKPPPDPLRLSLPGFV